MQIRKQVKKYKPIWESQIHKIDTYEYMRHPALHCKNPETDLIVFTDSALEASTIVIYSARWFVEDQYICLNLYVVQIF